MPELKESCAHFLFKRKRICPETDFFKNMIGLFENIEAVFCLVTNESRSIKQLLGQKHPPF